MSQAETAPAAAPAIDQAALDAAIQQTEQRMLERPELLQMRMENDSIMAECRVRPRNMEAIKLELTAQLEAFPDLAMASIFRKPVGKGTDGQMKFAEGLSIRAAEGLAEVYGFNRVRSDATPLGTDGMMATVEATFSDLQRGRSWRDGGVVSRRYKRRDGTTGITAEDRFWNVVVKAELSRRVREVILRCVNAGLKKWYDNECRKMLAHRLDEDTVKKIIEQFKQRGATLEEIEALVGKPMSMGWTDRDRLTLVGVWNAIETGETTPDEAFGRTTNDTQPRSADDVLGKPEPEPEPPRASEPAREELDPDQRLQEYLDEISQAGSVARIDELVRGAENDPAVSGKPSMATIREFAEKAKTKITGKGATEPKQKELIT